MRGFLGDEREREREGMRTPNASLNEMIESEGRSTEEDALAAAMAEVWSFPLLARAAARAFRFALPLLAFGICGFLRCVWQPPPGGTSL